MVTEIAVLIVEDSEDDAALLTLALRRHGFEPDTERVETAGAMAAALERRGWDVVLADYRLPRFSGPDALRLVGERGLDVPVILVSGMVGEEAAVEAMRAGAHDFVLKQNLARLGPAVARELRDADVRRERREAQAALERSEATQRFLADATAGLASSLDYDQTLRSLARAIVPEVADGCAIDLYEDGSSRPVAVTADEPDTERRLRELRERDAGPDELPSLRRTDAGESVMGVPMAARDQVLGALTLLRNGARGRYDREDLTFAQELARRAGVAVDNARLYERTQEAVAARDEFLSVASHELRTPLSSLVLQLGSLRQQLAKRPEAAADTRLVTKVDRAARAAHRLSVLVGDLLDVSRIATSGVQLELDDADLAEIAQDVAEQMTDAAARVGTTLRVHADGPAHGVWDRGRIAQVLSNLVSNALKYAPGRPVDITVATRRDPVRLSVRDYGIGIPPEAAPRIFDRFERAVPIRHYGGVGLGLYIARRIVEAHGGTIAVDSQPDEGARFDVELPRRPVHRVAPARAHP